MTDETESPPLPSLILLRVVFAFAWRTGLWMAVILLAGLAAAAATGIIAGLMGADKLMLKVFFGYFSFVFLAAGAVWAALQAFRNVLEKRFSGWRLALLPPEE